MFYTKNWTIFPFGYWISGMVAIISASFCANGAIKPLSLRQLPFQRGAVMGVLSEIRLLLYRHFIVLKGIIKLNLLILLIYKK
mgnify:CR=1 FL=1